MTANDYFYAAHKLQLIAEDEQSEACMRIATEIEEKGHKLALAEHEQRLLAPTDWNEDFDPQTLDPMFKERGLQTDIERYGHKAAWR